MVKKLGKKIPVFGVCLGHQAICKAYGAEVSYAKQLMHGKVSQAACSKDSVLFAGLPEQIPVGRYHSLAAVRETMPEELKVTAVTDDGEIMAVEHVTDPVMARAVPPESILTPDGKAIRKTSCGWQKNMVFNKIFIYYRRNSIRTRKVRRRI